MNENPTENEIKCPFCMEMIVSGAKKCKHCGELLDPALREIESLKRNQQQNQPVIVNNNNNNNNNNNSGSTPVRIAPPMAPSKSRLTYIILGLFLGTLGIHNFYAGYSGRGICQLLLTIFFCWTFAVPIIIFFWVIIELISVTSDERGVPFD